MFMHVSLIVNIIKFIGENKQHMRSLLLAWSKPFGKIKLKKTHCCINSVKFLTNSF